MNDNRRPVRSDKYQFLFTEIQLGEDVMSSFLNAQSINSYLNPFVYNDKVLELQDELEEKLKNFLLSDIFTIKQIKVIQVLLSGVTQTEAGKKIGNNQSSIHKALHGNHKIENGKKRYYGGIIRKANKLIKKNKEIQDLIQEINKLREEIW